MLLYFLLISYFNKQHFRFYINHYTRTTTWEDPRLKNVIGTKQNPHHMQHFSNDHVIAQVT